MASGPLPRGAGPPGPGLGYCYNPSFIALGEVVKGIEQPDYLLIGEADKHAGDTILSIHESVVKTPLPVARMRPVEAEIAKVASNTHETMRVSFANMLFSVCSEVPGADVDRVTEALAHRMGRRFFKGAVPYGGPCWPRASSGGRAAEACRSIRCSCRGRHRMPNTSSVDIGFGAWVSWGSLRSAGN